MSRATSSAQIGGGITLAAAAAHGPPVARVARYPLPFLFAGACSSPDESAGARPDGGAQQEKDVGDRGSHR
jgi:hypothetical protein